MKTKQFCDIYNSFTGEGGMMSGIDNPKQLKCHNFTGEELKEYTEHVISTLFTQPQEQQRDSDVWEQLIKQIIKELKHKDELIAIHGRTRITSTIYIQMDQDEGQAILDHLSTTPAPQPVSVSEAYNKAKEPMRKYFGMGFLTYGFMKNILLSIHSAAKLSTHQPTKIDEGWISVEDALPSLSPANECVNELPFSDAVLVKNEIGDEMSGVYDFTERSWIDPEYEHNIENSEEINGCAEYDHKITHWKAIAKLINNQED